MLQMGCGGDASGSEVPPARTWQCPRGGPPRHLFPDNSFALRSAYPPPICAHDDSGCNAQPPRGVVLGAGTSVRRARVCSAQGGSVYPARGAVWTTPYTYVRTAVPVVTAQPPPPQPAAARLGNQGTLAQGPVFTAAPATPEAVASSMQAALAQRAKAQEEEAAALAWLRVKPVNLPPQVPVVGTEPSDEQFATMFWEERRLPRVHCFGAFTQHSFATTVRRDGDALFALPDLGPL